MASPMETLMDVSHHIFIHHGEVPCQGMHNCEKTDLTLLLQCCYRPHVECQIVAMMDRLPMYDACLKLYGIYRDEAFFFIGTMQWEISLGRSMML